MRPDTAEAPIFMQFYGPAGIIPKQCDHPATDILEPGKYIPSSVLQLG
jgi:hypothetical protein